MKTTNNSEAYSLYPSGNSINIRWFSETPCRGKIILREAGSNKEQFSEETISTKAHNIYLSGLKAFSKYEYNIYPDGNKYSFYTTAPESCESFKFIVFGDPQGHKYLETTMALAAESKPHFAIGLGDFVCKANSESYLKFINSSRILLDQTALFPVPGNHDYQRCNKPFDHDNNIEAYDLFLGKRDGNNYFFDCGRLRFIMLNYPDAGTIKINDKSGKWLRQQLVVARRLNKKIILSHHCPCFTSTAIDWAVEDTLIPPLAEEFRDVLLIDFGAHIHTYERSMYPGDNGTCFITTGGAGELYAYPVNQRENKYQYAAADTCHVCIVEVTQKIIIIKAVDIENKELDCFEISY